jgi:hypothetical protein
MYAMAQGKGKDVLEKILLAWSITPRHICP